MLTFVSCLCNYNVIMRQSKFGDPLCHNTKISIAHFRRERLLFGNRLFHFWSQVLICFIKMPTGIVFNYVSGEALPGTSQTIKQKNGWCAR